MVGGFDIDEFDHLLRTARSVRRNLDFERTIPIEVIEACVDVAAQAPVSLAGENWRFLVIDDVAKKAQVAQLYRQCLEELLAARNVEMKSTHRALIDRLHEIPAMILVCAIGSPGETEGQQLAFYGSILPAAWSLMLALRARDIGTTWTTLLSQRQDELRALLNIPSTVTPTVMFPVGYMKGAKLKPAQRLPASELVVKNDWGDE